VSTKKFGKIINDFSRTRRRVFPWRPPELRIKKDETAAEPYRVLVSEAMLQQTQVSRVCEKYEAFIKQFPNVRALANAPLSLVLRAWQGLGYNRRALHLQGAAREILRTHKGEIPRGREALETLPGIGPATACAIRAFAFNEPEIFIETNIRSVFIHFFFGPRPTGLGPVPLANVRDVELLPLIEKTLDRRNPREWYYALMDYGTMLKKQHKNPSRRSTSHVLQKQFKGSLRQARGAVVRAVLEHPHSLLELKKSLRLESDKVEQAVLGLTEEGFLKKANRKYVVGGE